MNGFRGRHRHTTDMLLFSGQVNGALCPVNPESELVTRKEARCVGGMSTTTIEGKVGLEI